MNATATATLRALRTNISRRQRKTRHLSRFETLEQRQLLAADFSLQLATPLETSGEGEPALYATASVAPSTFQDNGLLIDHGNAPNGLPLLSSNPSAAAKIYLDFDGHFEPQWGSYSNITTPVWSLDSNSQAFSATEASRIRTIWNQVAEDFAPFNIDVTTIEPTSFANREGLRVAIGGDGSWFGNAGGVAYRNTWTNSIVNTVYVFPSKLSNNAKYIAEAVSHETGHALGLYHQSTYNSSGSLTAEYSTGSGNWAPIMGNGYSKARTTWHNGTTISATTYQDDLAVLSSAFNAFGYRQDDHGGLGSPTALTLDSNGNGQVVGVIERMNDIDAFSFEVTSTSVGDFKVEVFNVAPNLKAKFELWADNGVQLVTSNPDTTFGASFTYQLDPGTYTLAVRSDGVYGSLGHYTVKVDLNEIALPPVANDNFTSVPAGSDFSLINVLANDSAATGGNLGLSVIQVGTTSAGGLVNIVNNTQISYRPAAGFVGTESFTYTIEDGTPGNTATATVFVDVTAVVVDEPDAPDAPVISYLNLHDYTIDSYGSAGQDKTGPVEVINNGATLHMVGNRWKKIDFPYTVTPDTVLEFDFWSNHRGEIHGIGFDNTLTENAQRTFKVYGSQSWGRSNFNNYAQHAPAVVRYTIPVGEFYTGTFKYLFFGNDHDVANPTGESYFSNIRVYEKGEVVVEPPAVEVTVTAVDDQFSVAFQTVDATLDVLANDVNSDGVHAHLQIGNVSTTSAGGTVQIVDARSLRYTPASDFWGTETFTYTLTDSRTDATSEATVTIDVRAAVVSNAINLLDYRIDSYGSAGQDKIGPVEVIDNGATLHMVGNRWKKIDFPYTVTRDTVLEFDFQSNHRGEIHGIGFDSTLAENAQRTFKVYGSQNWGRSNFNNYAQHAPGVVRYVIPVGEFYTGNFKYLFFGNDHDVSNPTGESFFSNIRVYERDSQSLSGALPQVTGLGTNNKNENSHTASQGLTRNDNASLERVAFPASPHAASEGNLAASRNDSYFNQLGAAGKSSGLGALELSLDWLLK